MLAFAVKFKGLYIRESCYRNWENRFTARQAYVALSRVKNLSGVALLNFEPKRIYANARVHQEILRLQSLA